MKNNDVTSFLNELNHPLRTEIEELREIILSAESRLTENIKWNGPNYSVETEDRITMKIQPPKQIQLIFHRGVKKLAQPAEHLIDDPSEFLLWKENDRAIATFKSITDIQQHQKILKTIVQKWIIAA